MHDKCTLLLLEFGAEPSVLPIDTVPRDGQVECL